MGTSKKNIYFLFSAVILIWGIVIYRITAVVKTPEKEIALNDMDTTLPDFEEGLKAIPFSIQANYRDPFLGIHRKKTIASKKQKPKRIMTKAVVWPPITYHGIISPTAANKSDVYLLTINGQHCLLRPDESVQQVKLLRGDESGVFLKYKGEKKELKR